MSGLKPKVGLALGGGGARGLAHIPMLEVFDELGITPHAISGTSIGAVMGGLYASGHTGAKIRDMLGNAVISKGDSIKDVFKKKDFLKTLQFFDIELGRGGLFKGDRFIGYLAELMKVMTFEELKIPLKVVTADFWTNEQVVFETGDLPAAIKASMGLPGVFTPVIFGERVLIDGGGVNPLPHDLLADACDLVVAIDVMGARAPEKHLIPNFFDSVMGTFDIMQNSIILQKRKVRPPDIYIKPEILNIDILDFYKANEIYEQAEEARWNLREKLIQCLDKHSGTQDAG